MKNCNICLINDAFPPVIDGVANAVTAYARTLNTLGRVSVLTPAYPGAEDSVFPYPVLRYPSLPTPGSVGYRMGLPLSPELMGRVETAGFDLIHAHCPVSATLLGRLIRDRIDRPLVLTYHTKFDIDIARSIPGHLAQQEALHLLVQNIAACDEVWTVSRGAGENLRRIGYEGEYTVMPNGVDLPRGRVGADAVARETAGLDLPAGVPVFLFVGRLMWYKGIRIILEALARLQAAGQPFRMVFVGGGGDEAAIRALCGELALDGCVFFVPPVRDRERLRGWYCRADLFLFPSTFDTNGLVVREAAACGLASVLVRGSCAAEDTTDGRNAFHIEENAGSLAALLTRLCRSPESFVRVGQAAGEQLYLSWEEAVGMASERYGLVMDNYAAGRYARHDRLADELFHTTAQALDELERLRLQMRELRDGVLRELGEHE